MNRTRGSHGIFSPGGGMGGYGFSGSMHGNPLTTALNSAFPGAPQGSDPSALQRWWVEHGDEALMGAGGMFGPAGSGALGNWLHDKYTDNYWANNSWQSPNSGPVNHPDSVQGNTPAPATPLSDIEARQDQLVRPGPMNGAIGGGRHHGNTFGGGGWAWGTWNPSRIDTGSVSGESGGGDGPGLWDWITSIFSK